MADGAMQNEGQLVFEGQTLYTGHWKNGFTTSEGPELIGSKNLCPSELLHLFLFRNRTGVRLRRPTDTQPWERLEFRTFGETGQDEIINVMPASDRATEARTTHGLTHAVWTLVNDVDVRENQVFIPITTTCRKSDYMRLCNHRSKLPVTVAWGPLETWHSPNDYEYVLSADNDNDYSMMQDFLTVSGCVGLEYNGGGFKMTAKRAHETEYTALFTHSNVGVWRHCMAQKFQVTTSWVLNNFDQFVPLLKCNPNKMIDLIKTARGNPGWSRLDSRNNGWERKFTLWENRPDDLIEPYREGTDTICLNFHSVMRKDGFRQRFYGLFNHSVEHVRKTWYQVPEHFLRSCLKPACVKDLYLKAPCSTVIVVHKTGSVDPNACTNTCLRDCLQQIIPVEEVRVRALVARWSAPTSLKTGLAPIFGLTSLSDDLNYRTSRLRPDERDAVFDIKKDGPDETIIIRPSTKEGTAYFFHSSMYSNIFVPVLALD
jgi:hypothetical protein